MPANYRMSVDWNNDGAYAGPYDNVTDRTLDGRQAVSLRYGRDQARTLAPTAAGSMDLELDNRDKLFSPENASSPLSGSVLPGRPVLFQATLSGATYTLFRGQLDDFIVKPDRSAQSVDVSCLDGLARLVGAPISTALHRGIRTGEAVGHVLDAIGWPTDLRDIDSGAAAMPFWWVDNTDPFTALTQLVDSEGPPALLTMNDAGAIVFRDRHHRLTRAASLTAQSTWRSAGTIEPLISQPASYNHGWKELVNAVSFEVPTRIVSQTPAVIWQAQGRIALSAGETLDIVVRASDAFIAAVPPSEDVDYTAQIGSITTTLTRNSGQSTTLRLTAAGGVAVIDNLQVRGFPITTVGTTKIELEDPASITTYGRRSSTELREPVWANAYDAYAVAELVLGRRANRLPTITVSMVGANNTRLTQQLTRDLSDRIRVIETQTGLDADCFVEQISHTIDEGGQRHLTTFGLEKVPATAGNLFTFNTAGRGFNDGVFAPLGYDNPATMFRFDTTGQGFDQGAFAH